MIFLCVLPMKTIKRRGKKYYVVRDSRGRFKYAGKSRKKASIERKKSKVSFDSKNRQLKEAYQKRENKRLSKFSKNNVISRVKFTKVYEYRLSSPLRGKKGVMVIEFLFTKINRGFTQQRKEAGYSNKMSFPREFKKGYNLCLRRAMAKIDFSPDNVKVISVTYNYYISKNDRILN